MCASAIAISHPQFRAPSSEQRRNATAALCPAAATAAPVPKGIAKRSAVLAATTTTAMTRRSKGAVTNKPIGRRRKAKSGDANLNVMLRMCLEKVGELQHELNKADECEEDAQAAGYAACAMEALAFLAREGLPQEHPMVTALTEKLAAGGAPPAADRDQGQA